MKKQSAITALGILGAGLLAACTPSYETEDMVNSCKNDFGDNPIALKVCTMYIEEGENLALNKIAKEEVKSTCYKAILGYLKAHVTHEKLTPVVEEYTKQFEESGYKWYMSQVSVESDLRSASRDTRVNKNGGLTSTMLPEEARESYKGVGKMFNSCKNNAETAKKRYATANGMRTD